MTRYCCGLVPLRTGVLIITIIGILNKLSGFYGIISFDFSDMAAFAVYLYSLLSALVFVQGLYGLHTENVRIVRWYTIYFWIDCLVCLGTTVWFAVKWFMFTDHSLPELADDILKQQEHDEMFRMESIVSITLLAVLRLIHIYFAVVVTTYYKSLNTVQYAKLNADPEMVQANFDARIHQKREALD